MRENCICRVVWNFQRWATVNSKDGKKLVCPYCGRFYGYLKTDNAKKGKKSNEQRLF